MNSKICVDFTNGAIKGGDGIELGKCRNQRNTSGLRAYGTGEEQVGCRAWESASAHGAGVESSGASVVYGDGQLGRFTALEGYFDDVGSILEGKPIREVRTRYWKLREGENRLSVLLEGISIASLRKARRQGGSSITFVQVRFFIGTLIGVSVRFDTGIGTTL
ncbi:hypothetical protein GQ457_04G023620 [Hibiscus cannabinus]